MSSKDCDDQYSFGDWFKEYCFEIGWLVFGFALSFLIVCCGLWLLGVRL